MTQTMSASQGRLRNDFAINMAANAAGLISGLALVVVATRFLGKAEYGRLSWSLNATYLLAAASSLGLPLSVVAYGRRSADHADHQRFIARSLNATLLAAVGSGAGLCAIAFLWPSVFGVDFTGVARVTALLLVPTAVLAVASAGFRARGRFGLAALASEQVTRSLAVVGLFIAVVLNVKSARTIVIVTGLLMLGAAAAAYVWLGGRPSRPTTPRRDGFYRDTFPFFAGSLGATLIPQAGVITLGMARGANDVAILSVAIRVQMLCSLIAGAGGRVIAPRISARRTSTEQLTPVMRQLSTAVFWSTLLCALPFLVAGNHLIPLLFGHRMRDAWAPTVVLLLGLLVNVASGFAGQVLYNTGHEKVSARQVSLAGLAFLICSVFAARQAGAFGVALVASCIVGGLSVWQSGTAFRRTGVRPWTYPTPARALAMVGSYFRNRGGRS